MLKREVLNNSTAFSKATGLNETNISSASQRLSNKIEYLGCRIKPKLSEETMVLKIQSKRKMSNKNSYTGKVNTSTPAFTRLL